MVRPPSEARSAPAELLPAPRAGPTATDTKRSGARPDRPACDGPRRTAGLRPPDRAPSSGIAIRRSSRGMELRRITKQQTGAPILDAVAIHHGAGQRRDAACAGLDVFQVRFGPVERRVSQRHEANFRPAKDPQIGLVVAGGRECLMRRFQRIEEQLVVHHLELQAIAGLGGDRVDHRHQRLPILFPIQRAKEQRDGIRRGEIPDIGQRDNRRSGKPRPPDCTGAGFPPWRRCSSAPHAQPETTGPPHPHHPEMLGMVVEFGDRQVACVQQATAPCPRLLHRATTGDAGRRYAALCRSARPFNSDWSPW